MSIPTLPADECEAICIDDKDEGDTSYQHCPLRQTSEHPPTFELFVPDEPQDDQEDHLIPVSFDTNTSYRAYEALLYNDTQPAVMRTALKDFNEIFPDELPPTLPPSSLRRHSLHIDLKQPLPTKRVTTRRIL